MQKNSNQTLNRRHAAILILKEVGIHAPSLFFVYVYEFVELVWIALGDTHVPIRDAGGLFLLATEFRI